jgi:hypothetical protein
MIKNKTYTLTFTAEEISAIKNDIVIKPAIKYGGQNVIDIYERNVGFSNDLVQIIGEAICNQILKKSPTFEQDLEKQPYYHQYQ